MTSPNVPWFLFDRRDHELLKIVNEVRSSRTALKYAKKVFYPYFHPHGVKELSESKGLRIAYSVVYLLHSLEVGKIEDRLIALRSLRDEVLSAPAGSLPKNTARVLLEIMKELVRAHGDYVRQLELAHDFRSAMGGKPRLIRELLRRYHLLELPEEWNQIVFDDHVHDANTKGRKSATHLIMDAWIKGIRRLRVIYYNHIYARTASELLEAGAIMGIDVRVGIEFSARFRGKYIQMIWVPWDIPNPEAFLCFLTEPKVSELMAEGKKVSDYQQTYVTEVLKQYNECHRHQLGKTYGLSLDPLDYAEFRTFVGTGQASLLHLGQFIHLHLTPFLYARVSELQKEYAHADASRQLEIENLIDDMNRLDWETIVERYLLPEKNPSLHDVSIPHDTPGVPELLYYSPAEIANRLASLRSSFRITLTLSNVRVEDVLEILYDCQGLITRLEIFNLKDYTAQQTGHIPEISELQQAINKGNVINLKRIIRQIIERLKTSDLPDKADRIDKLTAILHDIWIFKDMYKITPLESRIGSDSTGRSRRTPGMGLAIIETLPAQAQREIRRATDSRYEHIPFHITVRPRITYLSSSYHDSIWKKLFHRLSSSAIQKDWDVQEYSTHMDRIGNVVTLGGIQTETGEGLSLHPQKPKQTTPRISWKYLNTGLKNTLKVLLGFIPAYASFSLKYDWWVLAYLGAFIWFGITGLRNIVQSVLGGGGVRRSPLLRWNDYVSWERLTDSLLFTGFSVPLLDVLIKTLLLNQCFGITVAAHPLELYAFIALANGIYLTTHNLFRGFSKSTAFGNFFRSVLSIPLAVAFNAVIGSILSVSGIPDIPDVLQKWAAVISKLASDCVAGIIEGTADRYHNIRLRTRDYETKLSQLFDTYTRLELMLPETQVIDVLNSSEAAPLNPEAKGMEKIMMIHALDLLYFWMYQPRARIALRGFLQSMSPEERQIFIQSQFVLQKHREVAQMFIDGILGRNFMKALAFYLDRSEEYLKVLQKQYPSK